MNDPLCRIKFVSFTLTSKFLSIAEYGEELVRLSKKYGQEHGLFKLWLGPFVPMVVLCDPKLAKVRMGFLPLGSLIDDVIGILYLDFFLFVFYRKYTHLLISRIKVKCTKYSKPYSLAIH